MRRYGRIATFSLGLVLLLIACPSPMAPDNDIVQVTGISLEAALLSLSVGDTRQLSATVLPAGATDPRVSWTSGDEAVAVVSAEGLVEAVSAGSTVITATTVDGGYAAGYLVTVSAGDVPVTGVGLSKTVTIIATGGSEQLYAIVWPAEATDQQVSWSSSDPGVAVVSGAGLITAVSVGTAEVTVTTLDGGFSDSCTVQVTSAAVPVSGITMAKSVTTLLVGYTEQLGAAVTPSEATNQGMLWSSSASSTVAVSPGGLIAGLQVGSAVVTATSLDGDFSATCDVTVATAATAVTGIALSAPPTEIFLGACQQLSFTIQPPEATDQRVTWASSDEAVARVSATGVVQPLSLGSVEITVTTVDGGHSDGCTVEVKPPVAVTGVSLDPSSAVLEVGDPPLQLQAVIEPANATVQTVSWSTSNDKVATVASSGPTSGEVTAVNAGTVVITAEVDDGAGGVFEESCTVTVKGVYVAGYVDVGGVSNGAYWVVTSSGNVRTDLPSSGSTWARDVCVVDGEVFVSGNHDGAELGTPCYWKNATRYDLPMSGDTLGAACGIVRDGSDVLVAGLRSSGTTFTACDWRITPGDPDIVERVDLATATTEDPTKLGAGGLGVDVAGGSVYVSGALVNSGTGVQEACYWQDNGTTIDHTVLHDRDHDPPYVASVAYGIVVKPGHVYVCGFQDDGSDPKQWDGYYWVDETPNPIEGDHCEPYALWVSSSGTVYIAGVESGTGCYWVDGVQQELLPAGYAYGITFQGDDLYISGDTGSGTPAAKACFWKNGAHHELDSPDTSGAVFIRAF